MVKSQCMVKSTLPLTMYGQVHFTTHNVWSSPLYYSKCMVKSTLPLTMYGQVHFTTHNVWSSPLYHSQCMVKSTLLLTMYGQVHFTTHNVWSSPLYHSQCMNDQNTGTYLYLASRNINHLQSFHISFFKAVFLFT